MQCASHVYSCLNQTEISEVTYLLYGSNIVTHDLNSHGVGYIEFGWNT